jgi:DNA-binding NarL/FixJ family response regulator
MNLLGRGDECALLDGLIDDIRRGESRSLVLRGEAGIGKSALLRYLVESASEETVVRAAGVEPEMELAFASLHQLCRPMLDRLERLPAPQRQALEIVFALRAGAAPDRFLVGLAVLGLLSEVADERPLLCVVDDAQWLDHASALTLAFVARRLLAEPVGIVFAAREPPDAVQHLPELDVHGLRDGDARRLLSSAVRFTLDAQVRDRIIAETHGNPLALLELPRGMTAIQLAGGLGLLGAQALKGRIEERFVRKLETLTDEARRLVLLAAAEPVGDPLLLWRAAERLGIAPTAAEAAEAQGLLDVGERVTFRTPLARSAVYRSAQARGEHREVHRALAEATDRDVDPDRRAWHLAAAADGPDEQVAVELERSAARAQARGGLVAAAAILKRAVALTHDRARRADRALAAAQVSVQAGVFDAALGLLVTAETEPLDELQRARVALMRAQVAFALSHGKDVPPLLLKAAQRLEPLDAALACETYLDALSAAMFVGHLAVTTSLSDVAEAARAAPRPATHPPRACDLLLDGLATLYTAGYPAGAPRLERALAAFRSERLSTADALRWLWLASHAATFLWDDESWHALSARQLRLARDAGALSVLPMALSTEIGVQVHAGNLAAAASLIEELDMLSEAIGVRSTPYGPLALAAWRGREAEARDLIDAISKEVTARSEGMGLTVVHWATAVLYNGLGRFGEALTAALRASRPTDELGPAAGALIEVVEAAVRSDAPDRAADALGRLTEMTRVSGTDWALGVEAGARALLSAGQDAEDLYREAIERLGRSRIRPLLARAHLVYGEWLRREHRRVDARAQLRAAHEQFTAIGMEAFAERARRELEVTGATVRKRTVETRDDLTAQERQIARLARDGLSNPEIGSRLFLSPRTVEWHLRKVFTKLDIHSRRELSSAMPGSESELARA